MVNSGYGIYIQSLKADQDIDIYLLIIGNKNTLGLSIDVRTK